MTRSRKSFERYVASWVPICAIPWFAEALRYKHAGNRAQARLCALRGAVSLKWAGFRGNKRTWISIGEQYTFSKDLGF